MKVSNRGRYFIKHFEGLRLNAYHDVAGKKTIGYGHLIRPHEQYERITIEEANRILDQDISPIEIYLSALNLRLTQEQFDACADFCFNLGMGAFDRSTLLLCIRSNDYAKAFNEFPKWNKAGGRVISGLTIRRKAEAELFANGRYV